MLELRASSMVQSGYRVWVSKSGMGFTSSKTDSDMHVMARGQLLASADVRTKGNLALSPCRDDGSGHQAVAVFAGPGTAVRPFDSRSTQFQQSQSS